MNPKACLRTSLPESFQKHFLIVVIQKVASKRFSLSITWKQFPHIPLARASRIPERLEKLTMMLIRKA